MIDKSLADLHNSGFEPDPTLDDDREVTGGERFAKGQKARDEVIIDSQLMDIAGKEGYFLKLKKELRQGLGEWMLMKTIETEWRQWADTETEVARIVREHTKISPTKWGTGSYRIEYSCRVGHRGKPYPVRDFYINAEEELIAPNVNGQIVQPAVDTATQVASQLDMLGKLLEVTRGFQPAQLDPAKIQEQQAAAFEKGLAIKAGEGNNSTVMMTTLITGLMGMMTALMTKNDSAAKPNENEGFKGMLETLKTLGVIGQQNQEKQKSFAETLVELKAIGLDIFKKEDPMEQMSKLKQLANIAGEFMGMGGTSEKPGILEKIVDMIGPSVPGMIKDAKDAMGNAVAVQIEAGKNIERAKIAHGPSSNVSNEGSTMNTAPNIPPAMQNNPQVAAFFNGLHEAAMMNNRMFYPIIYTSLLQEAQGQALITGIVNETHTAKELIELLQSYGDPRFKDSEFVMKKLVSFVNGFIMWIRQMMKPSAEANAYGAPIQQPVQQSSSGTYDVECTVCDLVYAYDSMQEFTEEPDKKCTGIFQGAPCTGMMQPLTKAS